MKIAGIIGGLGPESTVDYYRQIIAAYRERKADGSSPAILINSLDVNKFLEWMAAGKHRETADYLVNGLERLAKAGADFGVLSASTAHALFDEVERRSPIPLISVVQATCEAAKAMGLKRVGLFGTRFTMQGSFYPEVFGRAGIAVVAPSSEEQQYVHEKYTSELVKGIFLPETRERLVGIAQQMKTREGIAGLILGGTELPLILRDAKANGIPFLDTTQIHVKAIVARLLAEDDANNAPAM